MCPGSYGTSIGTFLTGKAPLAPLSEPGRSTFVEGTGLAMNTIPPNDFSYYEMLDALVQEQPAEALAARDRRAVRRDRHRQGQAVQPRCAHAQDSHRRHRRGERRRAHGQLHPTRVWKASAITARQSKWLNPLFVSGYEFMRPPPEITKEGVKPFPYTGARTLDARAAFFYVATGVTPAMIMRLPEIGSQYLFGILDSDGEPFDGAKTYKVTLPPNIPAAKFWSFTVYDNQTRSMLQTDQRFPRAGSQSYPSPAAEADADGSTTVYFGPKKPDGVKDGNFIQTLPGKGLVRDPAALQSARAVLRQELETERDRGGG